MCKRERIKPCSGWRKALAPRALTIHASVEAGSSLTKRPFEFNLKSYKYFYSFDSIIFEIKKKKLTSKWGKVWLLLVFSLLRANCRGVTEIFGVEASKLSEWLIDRLLTIVESMETGGREVEGVPPLVLFFCASVFFLIVICEDDTPVVFVWLWNT